MPEDSGKIPEDLFRTHGENEDALKKKVAARFTTILNL